MWSSEIPTVEGWYLAVEPNTDPVTVYLFEGWFWECHQTIWTRYCKAVAFWGREGRFLPIPHDPMLPGRMGIE